VLTAPEKYIIRHSSKAFKTAVTQARMWIKSRGKENWNPLHPDLQDAGYTQETRDKNHGDGH
jgi:hypothetical protein